MRHFPIVVNLEDFVVFELLYEGPNDNSDDVFPEVDIFRRVGQ
jgi:hypothetical protein